MSRINKFQEGHGEFKQSWDIPKKKRKNKKKGFRLNLRKDKKKGEK